MNYFIEIKNGQPFGEPIEEQKFKMAYLDVDVNNLPERFMPFIRVEKPEIGVYEVCNGSTYELVDDVYMDVHNITQLTEEEIKNKQDEVKSQWATTGRPSWIFNEEKCVFEPPVPLPNDGKMYDWNESITSWEEVVQ